MNTFTRGSVPATKTSRTICRLHIEMRKKLPLYETTLLYRRHRRRLFKCRLRPQPFRRHNRARPVSVNPLAPIASSVERDASSARAEERRLLEARPDQARPSDQREIKTIIVREERIIEPSAQAREPGSQPTPASALPPSNQPQRGDTKPPPVVVQTRIAPLVEKGLDFSLSRPSPQPQPTVRVTIGRIEVRAVGSPESPAKPRATPPVMNLDDYLRRRNQGSSR